MQRRWSLYNKEEKLRIDDLRPEQVRTILLAIPTAKMREWFACQEGDLHWQSIMDVPEFYEDVRELKGASSPAAALNEHKKSQPAPAPVAPARPLFEDAPNDSQTASVILPSEQDIHERRSAQRFSRELKFRVIQGGKSFESKTVDISMSGLSLVESLPNWVPKTFKAELELNGDQVEVVCNRVNDNKLQLKESESWDLLRKWLVNW